MLSAIAETNLKSLPQTMNELPPSQQQDPDGQDDTGKRPLEASCPNWEEFRSGTYMHEHPTCGSSYPDQNAPVSSGQITTLKGEVSSITTEMPVDRVLEIRENFLAIEERLKEEKKNLDAALYEWIKKNGAIEYGTTRFYNGVEKTTKCRDVKACFKALFEASGGDIDAVADILASGAFKHGAAKGILEGDWGEFFVTNTKNDIKTGKPRKKTIQVDTRYTGESHE